METTATTTAIAVKEVQEIISKAPQILSENIASVDKAKAVGENLLDLVKKDGMSDLLDNQLSEYQSKVKTTIKVMNERRKGFTQLVDRFKKEFTTLESALDPMFNQVQSIRDSYAQKKIAEQREKERIAEMNRKRELELVELRRQISIQLKGFLVDYISTVKNGLNEMFEGYTLETISSADIAIKGTSEILPDGFLNRKKIVFGNNILTPDEITAEIRATKTPDLLSDFNAEFKQAIASEKRSLIDKLPSKKSELEEIAKAGAEEKKKLEAEAQNRKDEESARIRLEEEDAKAKASEEATITASGESANAMVTAQAEMSFSEAPKVKEGYEIVVKNSAAYLQIAQFWFEKEGKNLSMDKIERKTFAQMRAFCEAWALKSEEKITSPFIDYKETIKAK